MLPDLFRIPFLNLPVHTYGALYVLALLVGAFVAYRQAKLGNQYHNDMLDFAFWALVGALLGARILFIIVESHYYFVEEPFTKLPVIGISIPTVLAIWKGGFVFWGGAIGGSLACVIFCKKRRIPFWLFGDLSVLGLSLGHAIGRIGCVAGGCCYGHPAYHIGEQGQVIADVPFALAFPKGSIAFGGLYQSSSPEVVELMNKLGTTVPLFPAQIFESLGNICIFFILLCFTPFKRAHGQAALLYLFLYSILRATAEVFRGDTERGFVIEGWLSTSQFISILVGLFALIAAYVLHVRNQRNLQVLQSSRT